MSAAFLVLCPGSPTRVLKRRAHGVVWQANGRGRLEGFTIERRTLAAADPRPDPSWDARVTAVIVVSGPTHNPERLEGLWGWMADVATATGGAIYSADDEEFVVLEIADAKARAKHLLATRASATLAAWIGATGSDHLDDDGQQRAEILAAIWGVVRSPLERAVRQLAAKKRSTLDAKQVATIAVALHDRWDEYDPDARLDAVVLAVASLAPTNRSARRAATEVAERHQIGVDAEAPMPVTVEAWQALVEGVGAKNASARRRFERFVDEDSGALTRLAFAAIEVGYEPPRAALACVLSLLPERALTTKQRRQLVKSPDAIALLRAAVATYRDAAGQRAAEVSLERYDLYEKYRTDPLVAKPRDRDIDIAMFRPLNDALYGPFRDRPQLPLRVAALLCDRRLDDARAAYVEAFGEANADAAIQDAAAYFAPDID